MFTISGDNGPVTVAPVSGSAAPSPDPSPVRHRQLVVECEIHMVSRIPILQTCNVAVVLEAETGFVPASAQFFAESTFLKLKFPS